MSLQDANTDSRSVKGGVWRGLQASIKTSYQSYVKSWLAKTTIMTAENVSPVRHKRLTSVTTVSDLCPSHLTPVSSDEVGAGGTMLAWIRRTLIQLLLTVAARVAQWALAVMGVAGVDTDA